MQREPGSDSCDELNSVFKEWRVEAPLPPRFREGVWRRIAIAPETRGDWRRLWQSLAAGWESLVRKPVGVAVCLAFFTGVGLGLGTWHAEAFTLSTKTTWQNAYFQSVSPTAVALIR